MVHQFEAYTVILIMHNTFRFLHKLSLSFFALKLWNSALHWESGKWDDYGNALIIITMCWCCYFGFKCHQTANIPYPGNPWTTTTLRNGLSTRWKHRRGEDGSLFSQFQLSYHISWNIIIAEHGTLNFEWVIKVGNGISCRSHTWKGGVVVLT